jgi:hypothetical protein
MEMCSVNRWHLGVLYGVNNQSKDSEHISSYNVHTEGKRPLRRPRRRCVDNIKMDLREIRWDGMDLIVLAQNRVYLTALVNTVINLWVP